MPYPIASTTRERVFTEGFIRYQYHLAEQASRKVISSGLLEGEKLDEIFDYMRSIYITVDGRNRIVDAEGGENRDQYALSYVRNTIDHFSKSLNVNTLSAKLKRTHPLAAVLQIINANIHGYTQTLGIRTPELEQKPGIHGFAAEGVSRPCVASTDEPLFHANFIRNQFDIFYAAGRLFDSSKICEEDKISPIISYMQKLKLNLTVFTVSGDNDNNSSYEGLFTLFATMRQQLERAYTLGGKSPFVDALDTIKNNIQHYIQVTQPQFSKNVANQFVNNTSHLRDARSAIIKDTCGILACLCWTPLQKTLTLNNGLNLCPEVSLPRKTRAGTTSYWDFCAPLNSIKALKTDIDNQSEKINQLHTQPIRQVMK